LAGRIEPRLADLTTIDCAGCDGLFFDPARRADGRRIWDVEQYAPPLSTIHAWRGRVPLRAAKVAPGIADEQVPPGCDLDATPLDGDLREATLWWRDDAPGAGGRQATLLSTGGAIHTLAADPATPPAPLAAPGRILYEPDPAVIRAHAV